jgi:hypothetical protein
MAILWLRFLIETEENAKEISTDLLENKEIQEALSLCEKGAFTPEELESYDQYWEYVRTERGVKDLARAEGRIEGFTEGEAKGRAKELERIVLNAYQNKLSLEQICAFSNLDETDILEILKRNNIMLN